MSSSPLSSLEWANSKRVMVENDNGVVSALKECFFS